MSKDLVGMAVMEEPGEGVAAKVALINKTTPGTVSRCVGWKLQFTIYNVASCDNHDAFCNWQGDKTYCEETCICK